MSNRFRGARGMRWQALAASAYLAAVLVHATATESIVAGLLAEGGPALKERLRLALVVSGMLAPLRDAVRAVVWSVVLVGVSKVLSKPIKPVDALKATAVAEIAAAVGWAVQTGLLAAGDLGSAGPTAIWVRMIGLSGISESESGQSLLFEGGMLTPAALLYAVSLACTLRCGVWSWRAITFAVVLLSLMRAVISLYSRSVLL